MRLAAAVLAAGLAGACAREAGMPRTVTGPRMAGVREGVAIHGRLTRRIQALGADAAGRAGSVMTRAFDAEVREGRAVARDNGPLVAVSSAPNGSREPVSVTDSAGHRHEFIAEGGHGAPPTAIRVLVDGRALARLEFAWRRSGDGFVLAHRVTTFYGRDGAAVAREVLSVELTDDQASLRRTAERVAGVMASAVLPSVLMASPVEMVDCFTAFVAYSSASGLVIYTADRLIMKPISLKNWVAFLGAAATWSAAFDTYINACSLANVPWA